MTDSTRSEDEQALKQARRLIEIRNANLKKLTMTQKAAIHACGAAHAVAASPGIVASNSADTLGEICDAIGRGFTRTCEDLFGAYDSGKFKAEQYFSPELIAQMDAEFASKTSEPPTASGSGETALGHC